MLASLRDRVVSAAVIAALSLLASAARADPPNAAAPSAAAASASAEAEARAHFKRGAEHLDKGEYREALDAFRKSLELTKTRGAMASVAACLKLLGRYDEALDAYEELRRDFPKLSPALEAKVGPAMADLEGLVGTLEVAGDAPAGASLFVDGRLRGKLPLSAPLRVGVGSHSIRVEKDGFEAILATAEIEPRQLATLHLAAKSRKGILEVRERHNFVLHVNVDGKDVGVTPWAGLVDAGEHRVRLHGFMATEAVAECAAPDPPPGTQPAVARGGVKMESRTVTVTTRLYDVSPVVLDAEDQDTSLRIESTPAGASVRIDERDAGKTPWEGRLGLGSHTIEVAASGYLAAKQEVKLERRKEQALSMRLEREPDLGARADAARRHKLAAGLAYGVGALGLGVFGVTGGLALDMANDLKAVCEGQHCPRSERANIDTANALGTAATAGLVVGLAGAAAGTVVLIAFGPGDRPPGAVAGHAPLSGGVAWSAGVGLGRFAIQGEF